MTEGERRDEAIGLLNQRMREQEQVTTRNSHRLQTLETLWHAIRGAISQSFAPPR